MTAGFFVSNDLRMIFDWSMWTAKALLGSFHPYKEKNS